MINNKSAYRKLQKHLNKMPQGYPATKSGVEISLLESIFTPEQAKIVTYLDYKYKTLDQVFESAKGEISSKEELKRILDEVVSNGGISRRRKNGEEQYATLPFVSWGMYEHQLKRTDQEFLDNSNEYMKGEFGLELATGRLPVMRTIPVKESIKVEHHITTYENMRHLIETSGDHIAVQDCFCKKAGDLQAKPCVSTDRRELCMSFGDLAELYIEEGWARRLEHDEAMEIVHLNEQEGLVLMPGNSEQPNFICSCCSDCCLVLNSIKNYPKPAEAVASNYYASVNNELCEGVGDCVTRCPMDAISLVQDMAIIRQERCIGCGLCVPACSKNAISMIKKEVEIIPPATIEERFDYELEQKSSFAGRIRNFSLKTFIRIMTKLASQPESKN